MARTATETKYKRKFPRRIFRRAIGFLFEGNYIVGFGEEIGEGGLSIQLPKEFPIQKEAVLSFQLVGGSFVSVRVELRNITPTSNGGQLVGCAFKNLKFEHKREIRSYVSARPEFEQ
jgi:hypothetical protein